jgi:hypothetical protein
MIGGMENTSTLVPLRFMARRLRVPVQWLRAEALARRIPHLNANGQILFNASAVDAVLSSRAAGRAAEERVVSNVNG